MANAFDVLEERGFIEQGTHSEELRELLGKESITFYVGFDATASSLTMGHLIPLMSMRTSTELVSSALFSCWEADHHDW